MYEKIKSVLDEQERDFAWLSRQTGIHENTFYMMKKRGSNMRIENLQLVAKVLKKPASYFLK